MGARQSSIIPSSSLIINVKSTNNQEIHQIQKQKTSRIIFKRKQSSQYNSNNKTTRSMSNPHKPIVTDVGQCSFNSIPTHLSSSSKSENVYSDSSNYSSDCGVEDFQSCKSFNSSTSSIDESCVSSSNFTHVFHSNRAVNSSNNQHKKSHETNLSSPAILPSHESCKIHSFEKTNHSLQCKSLDHPILRRIKSESSSELLLSPQDNTTQSAHFPSIHANSPPQQTSGSPKFKSNKVHCILQLNSQKEVENNNQNEISTTDAVCEIRNSYSPIISLTRIEPQDGKTSNTLSPISTTRQSRMYSLGLGNKSKSLSEVVSHHSHDNSTEKKTTKMSEIRSMYVEKQPKRSPTLSESFSIPLLTVTRA